MASPSAESLSGDNRNFTFSPSSPPTFPAFPQMRNIRIDPHPSFNPLDSSSISPALYNSPPSAHPQTHLAHLSMHQDADMQSYESDDADLDSQYPTRSPQRTTPGKRAARLMEDEPEDYQRRGPAAADTPGGDCKSLCVRHQKMANGGTNLLLQKSIELLPPNEQAAVNTIWSLFSSSPSARRLLILQGILTIACPSQLSFLQTALTLEMRVDPVEVLPREIGLKIFGYLDAISLGRAAQVSRQWSSLANDDVLWRAMCEQHIERKCEKCGWGLPLLPSDRRRKARAKADKSAADTRSDRESMATSSAVPMTVDTPASGIARPSPKRVKTESPAPSRSATPTSASTVTVATSRSAVAITRPWKSVYCERFAIERNWRKGIYTVSTLSGHTDSVTCLQVAEDLPHPNFPVLMTGSWDRSVRIWNLELGKEVGVIRGHTRGIRALQFDAVKLITGSMDSTLKIWNWRTGECLRTLRGHTDAVICLAYDKQILVSGSADSTIRVWDFGTGEVYALRGHREWVNAVALWDSNTGFATTSHEGDLGRPANDPAVARESSRGKFLVSASDDMTIRFWNLYTRECVRVLTGHVAQVQSLRVVTADGDDAARSPTSTSHAKMSSGGPLSPRDALDDDQPNFFANATGGSCATSTGGSSTASAFLPGLPSLPPVVDNALPPIAFAGDKRPCIVSASLDNTIKLWDVETGVCRRTLFGHIEGVWDVAVDKLRVVSASHDRTLKIWDKDTGRNLHTLVGHTSAVTAVTLQDAYLVSGSDDGNARVWHFA